LEIGLFNLLEIKIFIVNLKKQPPRFKKKDFLFFPSTLAKISIHPLS